MASKALMVSGFLLVALLFIVSEVAAILLDEKAKEAETKEPVNHAKYVGDGSGYTRGRGPGNHDYLGYCKYRCCGYAYYGVCRCCTYEGEVPDFKGVAKPHN